MLEIFYSNLNAKAAIAQKKIFEIDDLLSTDGKAKKDQIIKTMNEEIFVFDPNEPKARILYSLQLMGRLSNTIAFEKLKSIGGIRI